MIPKIYKALEDNGSPKPLFDTDDSNRSFFVVEFPIYPDFKDIDEGGAIKLTDRQNEIIEIIKSDNKISYRAIAKKLDINDSAVDKHIKSLKEKGIYCRKACCYLFSFLSKENKLKNKLCVLCGSAVIIVLSKTLSRSPFNHIYRNSIFQNIFMKSGRNKF